MTRVICKECRGLFSCKRFRLGYPTCRPCTDKYVCTNEQMQGARRAARDVTLVFIALFMALVLEWLIF